MRMRLINDQQQMESLLIGLGILGTGGGGDPDGWGKSVIKADFAKGREYRIFDPKEIDDEALVVSGGYLGSVAEDQALDRIIDDWEDNFELEKALKVMEDVLGKHIDYLVPFELGGGNTPVILSAGARLGIPVIDGDALGRAAPETQMTSFIGHGVQLTPMPLVGSQDIVIIVKVSNDIFFPDEIGRFVVSVNPGLIANAHYPMSGAALKRAVVPNTITKAISLGRFVSSLTGEPEDKLTSLSEYLRGFPLLWGKVTTIKGENRGGFYFAHARITGLGGFKGHTVDLTIKNEVMCARLDAELAVIFPDLVLLIDPYTNKGIMTPELREGKELIVIGLPCHSRLREALKTPIGAQAFAPERYDEKGVYQPVENLLKEVR